MGKTLKIVLHYHKR